MDSLTCKTHQYYSPITINLSEQKQNLLECVQCIKEKEITKGKSIFVIKELLTSHESTIFDNWPPLEYTNFLQILDQLLKSNIPNDLETKIPQYFIQIKQKINNKLDEIEKKMMKNCFEFQSYKKNLLDAYNNLAEKDEMKNILLNSNNYDETNVTIKQLVQKKQSEKVENTSILEQLFYKLQQQHSLIDFSIPIKIQNNILEIIGMIDFYKGINNQNLQIMREIQYKLNEKIPSSLQIFVKIQYGRTITLNVNELETIENLKFKIQKIERVSPEQQTIFFNNQQLEDEKTISDYKIQQENTLQLVVFLPQVNNIQISIQTQPQKIINLRVLQSFSIEDVKANIQEKEGILSDQQILSLDEKYLEDKKTLAEYGIKNQSTLNLKLRQICQS